MTDHSRTVHDSMGLLHFSRWSSSHSQSFFGSDLKHDRGIRLTIMGAGLERSLNADRYFEQDLILSADLTEAQFAEMITTLNTGTGVPITLKSFRDGDIVIPAPLPDVPKGELVLSEARNKAKQGVSDLRSVLSSMRELLDKGNLRKGAIKQLINELENAIAKFDDHVPFMLQQFQRTVEKMVLDATATIRAASPPVVIDSLSEMGKYLQSQVFEDHTEKKAKKRKKGKKGEKSKRDSG